MADDALVRAAEGTLIACRDSLTYLGALLTSNGSIADELKRRLGMAKADFNEQTKAWKHATISLAAQRGPRRSSNGPAKPMKVRPGRQTRLKCPHPANQNFVRI